MRVRSAIPEDKAEVTAAAHSFFVSAPRPHGVTFKADGFGVFFDAMMQADNGQFWVALDHGRVVGTVAAVSFPVFYDPDSCVVQEIIWWVDPDYRDGTASRELIGALEAWASDRNATQVMMSCVHNSRVPAMARMYRARGYQPIEHLFARAV